MSEFCSPSSATSTLLMQNLPSLVLSHIFSYLDLRTTGKITSVCRRFCNIMAKCPPDVPFVSVYDLSKLDERQMREKEEAPLVIPLFRQNAYILDHIKQPLMELRIERLCAEKCLTRLAGMGLRTEGIRILHSGHIPHITYEEVIRLSHALHASFPLITKLSLPRQFVHSINLTPAHPNAPAQPCFPKGIKELELTDFHLFGPCQKDFFKEVGRFKDLEFLFLNYLPEFPPFFNAKIFFRTFNYINTPKLEVLKLTNVRFNYFQVPNSLKERPLLPKLSALCVEFKKSAIFREQISFLPQLIDMMTDKKQKLLLQVGTFPRLRHFYDHLVPFLAQRNVEISIAVKLRGDAALPIPTWLFKSLLGLRLAVVEFSTKKQRQNSTSWLERIAKGAEKLQVLGVEPAEPLGAVYPFLSSWAKNSQLPHLDIFVSDWSFSSDLYNFITDPESRDEIGLKSAFVTRGKGEALRFVVWEKEKLRSITVQDSHWALSSCAQTFVFNSNNHASNPQTQQHH